MDGWDQLMQDATDFAREIVVGGHESQMMVFTGGWHVWGEVSEVCDDFDRVVAFELSLTAAAVPPTEPTEDQRRSMVDGGWTYTPSGPGFEIRHRHPAQDDAAERLASIMVDTLRCGLEVPHQQPVVGPTHLWSSLPGAPQPTEQERAEVAAFLEQLEASRARRKARMERSRPHQEASEALQQRALSIRDQHRDRVQELRRRNDFAGLIRHEAFAAAAKEALGAAALRAYDPGIQKVTEQVLGLLDAGRLEGVWELLPELFARSEAARDRQLEQHRQWLVEREQETQLVKVSGVATPSGPGRDTSWHWHTITTTAVAIAEPRDVLLEALRRGVVTLGDVEYALASVPRTRGSQLGACRRELLKQAREAAAVQERHAGSYDPPSTWR
jgi:hypothetical protein